MTNSTRWIVFAVAALAAVLPAQDSGAKALARAQLLEQQEGDLAAAQAAYRALLDDKAAEAQHGEAALRLGALLWRLDQRDAARPMLERAVAAGGTVGEQATAVLQGQGEQGKLAQERLATARAVVRRLVDLEWQRLGVQQTVEAADGEILSSLQVQLRRMPDAAAAALIESLASLQGSSYEESQLRTAKGEPVPQRALAALLWEIGGKATNEFFARLADDPNLAVRRFVTRPLRTVQPAKDLEPALTRFAQDADPTNEVWQNVTAGIARLEVGAQVRLLRETHAGARAAGMDALGTNWHKVDAPQRDAIVAEHGARIAEATRGEDGLLADSAWELIRSCGYYGPDSACALFLSAASRSTKPIRKPIGGVAPELDDAWLHELRVAADQLGRPATGKADSESKPRWKLRDDVESAIACWLGGKPSWTSKGIDDALRLLDLDYGMFGDGEWLQPVLRTGSPEQVAQLIPRLRRVGSLSNIAGQLTTRKPEPVLFPPLRALVEACLEGDSIPWAGTQSVTRVVAGRQVMGTAPKDVVATLFRAIGNTRAPEAAAWFPAIVDRHPEVAAWCRDCLIEMSKAGADGATAGLRKLLVWPGTDVCELGSTERTWIFAELARRGDVEAIPLFPRAYELGLSRLDLEVQGERLGAAGIGFLADAANWGTLRPRRAWHAYRDEDLVTAWRTLLDSNAANAVWIELTGTASPTTATIQPGFLVPMQVTGLVLEHLEARWAGYADRSVRQTVEGNLLSRLAWIPASAIAGDSALARTLRDLFTKGDANLAATCFNYLAPDVARVFAPEARQLLRRTTMKQIVFQMQRAGVELTVDDWRDLLRNREADALLPALRALPPRSAPELRGDIEPALAHESPAVRIAACHAMQRLYAADAVANLLPLLKDSSDEVRKAARTSLDELREEYERGSFWAKAKSGIDTTPASAAAKLLAQAQAGEAKEQRVLALRSLGLLGAPEALPYLIDATKDADAEIAQAAREAIARIHAKAGPDVKKPESK